jgi:two-component system sensor histidine kinase/response regulator
MPSDFCFIDSRILTAEMFERLSLVMQEFARPSESALLVTEASLPSLKLSIKHHLHRFVVVASPQFSGLLLGQAVPTPPPATQASYPQSLEVVERSRQENFYTLLRFDPSAIATFLSDLQAELAPTHPLHDAVTHTLQHLKPNHSEVQAEFSLRLAEVMSHSSPLPESALSPKLLLKLPQSNQDAVLGEVATQIRQTQELSLILQTALRQVRSFLQVERVVIYEFETVINGFSGGKPLGENTNAKSVVCGRVTYEDRAYTSIPRILNLSEGIQCFLEGPNYQDKYREGAIQAIADVRDTYADAPCLVEMLDWAQVRAKLVVPIVLQDDLWGLLIAHQCSGTRDWQESEIQFLRGVAELLAIAIYQNQIYSQLQLQTQTLEQRVVERTQELYDAMNAAQSASNSKTEFLATVSHELRTPLTAIIGMSTTLLRLPADDRRNQLLPIEKQQEYLQIIRSSGEHLLALINDIIDLSQVEAGRAVLDLQEFSLSQLAHDCLRMLRDRASQNQIQLELNLPVELSPNGSAAALAQTRDRFVADPRRIKQILLNLLSNAIKFTPEGGKVTLRIWVEAGNAYLQVEDTGIGIPRHKFPLLFQKFQQLEHPYHRKYEGTGLGLALTKQLVELHGGQIEVDSTVDVGSTFTVVIPAQPLKVHSPKVAKSLADLANFPPGGRVVLIENDEAIANLICDLLTAGGYQVIWIMDGNTALQQMEIVKPEAVLIDAQLTGMGTGEILQRLRQNPTLQSVRVLLLSHPEVSGQNPDLMNCADASLTLPLNRPEELLDQIRGAIAV